MCGLLQHERWLGTIPEEGAPRATEIGLKEGGVMLVDMDSPAVNPNHIANDPDRTHRPPQDQAHQVRR